MARQIVRLHLPGSGDQVLSGKHSLQTEFKIFTNEWHRVSGEFVQEVRILQEGEGEFLRLNSETASYGGKVDIGYNSHAVTGLLVEC